MLGNILAVVMGMLIANRNNIISEEGFITMHIGLTVLLGFMSLFWVVRLVRYKLKFSDFKMLLTTWLIYVLCLLSLGLNVTTFTSAVAYRTAGLYSDEVVEADFRYLHNDLETKAIVVSDDGQFLYGANMTEMSNREVEEMLEFMSRHGYQFNRNDNIRSHYIGIIKDRLLNIKLAKIFVQQPFLKRADYCDYKKRSSYHVLLNISWSLWIIALFFLPILLFLLSVFGVRTTLISAFLTTMIIGLKTLTFNVFHAGSHYAERLLSSYIVIAFVLLIALTLTKNRLRSWNNIAGTLLLITGVIFFAIWVFTFRQQGRLDCSAIEMNFLPMLMNLLPFSLLVSVVTAWLITKQNADPTLH